jgi:hypothetical protein
MNRTEQEYAGYLEAMRRLHEIVWWRYEPLKLRLARATYYTPDFLVLTCTRIELHEVKGHWEDDARVKWKTAAEMNPWAAFAAAQREGGGWKIEWYGQKDAR